MLLLMLLPVLMFLFVGLRVFWILTEVTWSWLFGDWVWTNNERSVYSDYIYRPGAVSRYARSLGQLVGRLVAR